MKTKITYKMILALNPCYDPIQYIPKNYTGTVVDILKLKKVPAKDRLWVVVRANFLSLSEIKEYGLACARLCEKNSTDKRVKKCNDTVAKYLNGKATLDQVSAARSAAWSAAESAVSTAWSAAEELQVKALLKILKKRK